MSSTWRLDSGDPSAPLEAGALIEINSSLEDANGGLGIAELSLGDADGDLEAPAGNLGDSFAPETNSPSVK